MPYKAEIIREIRQEGVIHPDHLTFCLWAARLPDDGEHGPSHH